MIFGKKVQQGIAAICLGDSFTAGATLLPGEKSYVNFLSDFLGATATNLGVSSTETGYATAQILQFPDLRKWPITYFAGCNDSRRYLANAANQITSNLRSAIACAFLQESVPASSLGRVGTWTALSPSAGARANSIGGTGLYTTDVNAYLGYDFTGETLVVGGVSSLYDPGPGGGECQDIDVIIDGGAPITLHLAGMTSVTFGYNALVVKNLGPGKHRAIIKPKNGLNWSAVDYVGT